MKDTDLAYAAGVVDGEGCIGIYGSQRNGEKRFQLTLQVNNGDIKMIDKFIELFGGNVNTQEPGPNNKSTRTNYVWRVVGKRAVEVLEMLLPYLITKRDQALVGISYREASNLERGSLGDELKRLKKVTS